MPARDHLPAKPLPSVNGRQADRSKTPELGRLPSVSELSRSGGWIGEPKDFYARLVWMTAQRESRGRGNGRLRAVKVAAAGIGVFTLTATSPAAAFTPEEVNNEFGGITAQANPDGSVSVTTGAGTVTATPAATPVRTPAVSTPTAPATPTKRQPPPGKKSINEADDDRSSRQTPVVPVASAPVAPTPVPVPAPPIVVAPVAPTPVPVPAPPVVVAPVAPTPVPVPFPTAPTMPPAVVGPAGGPLPALPADVAPVAQVDVGGIGEGPADDGGDDLQPVAPVVEATPAGPVDGPGLVEPDDVDVAPVAPAPAPVGPEVQVDVGGIGEGPADDGGDDPKPVTTKSDPRPETTDGPVQTVAPIQPDDDDPRPDDEPETGAPFVQTDIVDIGDGPTIPDGQEDSTPEGGDADPEGEATVPEVGGTDQPTDSGVIVPAPFEPRPKTEAPPELFTGDEGSDEDTDNSTDPDNTVDQDGPFAPDESPQPQPNPPQPRSTQTQENQELDGAKARLVTALSQLTTSEVSLLPGVSISTNANGDVVVETNFELVGGKSIAAMIFGRSQMIMSPETAAAWRAGNLLPGELLTQPGTTVTLEQGFGGVVSAKVPAGAVKVGGGVEIGTSDVQIQVTDQDGETITYGGRGAQAAVNLQAGLGLGKAVEAGIKVSADGTTAELLGADSNGLPVRVQVSTTVIGGKVYAKIGGYTASTPSLNVVDNETTDYLFGDGRRKTTVRRSDETATVTSNPGSGAASTGVTITTVLAAGADERCPTDCKVAVVVNEQTLGELAANPPFPVFAGGTMAPTSVIELSFALGALNGLEPADFHQELVSNPAARDSLFSLPDGAPGVTVLPLRAR